MCTECDRQSLRLFPPPSDWDCDSRRSSLKTAARSTPFEPDSDCVCDRVCVSVVVEQWQHPPRHPVPGTPATSCSVDGTRAEAERYGVRPIPSISHSVGGASSEWHSAGSGPCFPLFCSLDDSRCLHSLGAVDGIRCGERSEMSGHGLLRWKRTSRAIEVEYRGSTECAEWRASSVAVPHGHGGDEEDGGNTAEHSAECGGGNTSDGDRGYVVRNGQSAAD